MNIEKYKFIIEEIIHRTEVGYVISKYLAGKKKKEKLFDKKILGKENW